MKTLREYIDQLDEISRRDFLKGAGAAAVGAAVGKPKNSTAGTMYYIPGVENTESDPPLPRKVKWRWNYYNPESLSEEQRKQIGQIIQLMYVARMSGDNYRDSQGGRVISDGIPSKIYKEAYDLLVFINDSFTNLGVAKAMNTTKEKLETIQKETPQQWQKIQEHVLNQWIETLAKGKLIKQRLGGESQSSQTEPSVAPTRPQPQSTEPQKPVQTRMVPDANIPYERQLGNHINLRINYPKRTNENPEAVVKIEVLPTGELKRVMLIKPSGDKEWDRAVENAIINSSPLPLRQDGTIPSNMELSFRPHAIKESEDLKEASPDAIKRIEELIKYK